MMTPTIIRCSALSGYPDCPRRTAARLFRAEIQDAGHRLARPLRGIGAAIGTAVHEAARITLSDVAHGLRLSPENVAGEIAAAVLVDDLNESEVAYDTTTANRGEATRQAVRMAWAYRRAIAPDIQPILVEERFEAEIAPDVVLSGAPDVVAREPGRIRDLKTGRTSSPGTHAPQIGGYSLLARTHGLEIEDATIDYIQRSVPSRPQPEPTSTTVPIRLAETAASNIVRHIEGDLRTFRKGDPARKILPGDPWAFLANPASILCSPKYCSAFGTTFCREGEQ